MHRPSTAACRIGSTFSAGVDGSQRHDHVADLLHLQVDAHLPCVLGCDQQRARGGQDLRPAVVEDGYVAGRLSQ